MRLHNQSWLWKGIITPEIEGTICDELGDATESKFIAFHDYDTLDLGGLLQKGLHPKPTSHPKKTSLD